MIRVRTLAPGPAGHGVVRHAAAVAALTPGTAPGGDRADLTHAQFTDALWGPDVASAAAAFTAAARAATRPLVVTLHDLPGADPDPARDARRTVGYARVAAAADVVVVSSRHEAAKVRAFGGPEPEVVPLPLPSLPSGVDAGPRPSWADHPTLGVLGFVYPGKGHAEALAAAGRHPSRPRVVAAGAVSPGHDALWTGLGTEAERLGVELVATGPLNEADLAAAVDAVTVPLSPNRLVSASGSLLAWIAGGRVPLAADGPYAREVAAAAPGAVDVVEDLDAGVDAALADPARTRRRAPVSWPDAGAGHAAVYARALVP